MTELQLYCRDCTAAPGERHNENCCVARCSECGEQFITCEAHVNVNQPSTWTGEWPGVAECREFGWYTEPDSPWGVMEDLNRLAVDEHVEWDKQLERFVLVP